MSRHLFQPDVWQGFCLLIDCLWPFDEVQVSCWGRWPMQTWRAKPGFVKKAFDRALQPKLQLHLNIIAAIYHMFKVCGDMRCVLRAFGCSVQCFPKSYQMSDCRQVSWQRGIHNPFWTETFLQSFDQYTNDICPRACIYVCMHACMHACMYVCTSVCLFVCLSIWLIWPFVCLYVPMLVRLYGCMYVCMYVGRHVGVWVSRYVET